MLKDAEHHESAFGFLPRHFSKGLWMWLSLFGLTFGLDKFQTTLDKSWFRHWHYSQQATSAVTQNFVRLYIRI